MPENPVAAPDRPVRPLPPPAPPSSTNGLGIAGFVVSVVAPCTFFLLSPIALLLSGVALMRPPRGLAIAGTAIGGFGTLLLVTVFATMLIAATHAGVQFNQLLSFIQTNQSIPHATAPIQGHHSQHDALPDDTTGNDLIDGVVDGWGTQMRYEKMDEDRYRIISAGPDQQFDTGDDITFPIHVDDPDVAEPRRRRQPQATPTDTS